MTYKIIRAVAIVFWLIYCTKVLVFRSTASRQDAIIFCGLFVVGFALSLYEAIKLRNARTKKLRAHHNDSLVKNAK